MQSTRPFAFQTLWLGACAGLVLATPIALSAAITINFTYGDFTANSGASNNFGFADPVHGAARRATVEAVGNYLGSLLDHTATVDIVFQPSTNNTSTNTLASAGSYYGIPNPITTYLGGLTFDHITSGVDPTTNFPDAVATVNFGYSWYAGLATPGANEFDLYSVMLHELTHTLGFSSLLDSDGLSVFASYPNAFSRYDSHLTDNQGTSLFSGSPPTFDQDQLSVLTNPATGVYFQGPQVNSLMGSQGVKLYTPTTYSPGSSISHFQCAPSDAYVMCPSIGAQQVRRSLTPLDIAVLQDIGYQFASVPEPSSYILLGLFASLLALAHWIRGFVVA